MGLAALEEWESVLQHRQQLLAAYEKGLTDVPGIRFVGASSPGKVHAAWLCTLFAKNRMGLQRKLREHRIESNQVHYRNDRYTIFRECRGEFPNMDAIEDDYLVLPLHTRMGLRDVERVVEVIRSGW